MPKKNYCSVPGFLGLFPFFRKYSKLFNSACAGHDWLYENACELEMTQFECDIEFYLMMLDLCKEPEDYKAAWIYFSGVRVGGANAYKESGVCKI